MRNILFSITMMVVILSVCVFSQGATAEDNHIVAYYFHGNFRCYSCNLLERYSREALEENFKDELLSGKIVFKTVNVDDKPNNHFVSDYGLYSQSLVLSLVQNGKETKFKNLTMIWQYARDRQRFFNYVKDEVNAYLEDLS